MSVVLVSISNMELFNLVVEEMRLSALQPYLTSISSFCLNFLSTFFSVVLKILLFQQFVTLEVSQFMNLSFKSFHFLLYALDL